MKKLLAALLVLAVLLAVAAAAVVHQQWTAEGPLVRERSVIIARGSSVGAAAHILEAEGVVASAERFSLLARIFGSDEPIKAGEFQFPAGLSAAGVFARLQDGKVVLHRLTIPEGMPSVLVHDRIMKTPLLVGDADVPAEGSVLPDTYSYERGEQRAAVLARMQAAMTKTLDVLWAERKDTSVVTTKEDAINLAAIVEKETAKPSERRLIAGVYSNRLRIGMLLQADPTVIYPVTRGKRLGRRIRRSELRAENDYNTYVKGGLPKGPIANPGREAIAAVLDPADTEALFFVADGTGGHAFARTVEEHESNVRKWRAIQRQRGER